MGKTQDHRKGTEQRLAVGTPSPLRPLNVRRHKHTTDTSTRCTRILPKQCGRCKPPPRSDAGDHLGAFLRDTPTERSSLRRWAAVVLHSVIVLCHAGRGSQESGSEGGLSAVGPPSKGSHWNVLAPPHAPPPPIRDQRGTAPSPHHRWRHPTSGGLEGTQAQTRTSGGARGRE